MGKACMILNKKYCVHEIFFIIFHLNSESKGFPAVIDLILCFLSYIIRTKKKYSNIENFQRCKVHLSFLYTFCLPFLFQLIVFSFLRAFLLNAQKAIFFDQCFFTPWNHTLLIYMRKIYLYFSDMLNINHKNIFFMWFVYRFWWLDTITLQVLYFFVYKTNTGFILWESRFIECHYISISN